MNRARWTLPFVVACAGLASTPAHAAPAATCNLYADASAGSDQFGSGSSQSPYQTIGKVLGGLSPGQTGCLAGTFGGAVTFTMPGATGQPITLTSTNPAAPATLTGTVLVRYGADHVKLLGLKLDQTGVNDRPGLRIEANDVAVIGNEIVNDTLACIFVGPTPALAAADTRIEGNNVHDCGGYGVQLDSTSGAIVTDNRFSRIMLNAVDLYPAPDNTQILNNAITTQDVGIKFFGDANTRDTNTVAKDNVISGSATAAVTAEWSSPNAGTNTVTNNCVTAPGIRSTAAYTASDNSVVTDIRNAACAGKGPQPAVLTDPATDLAQTTAVVHGVVNPRGEVVNVAFEYGTTDALGSKSTAVSSNPFTVPETITQTLTGLSAGQKYSYRIAATTAAGVTRTGAIKTFTTAALPDGDGDGVPDQSDKCPTVSKGTFDVNNDGCPDNSDKDDVIDEKDKCPTVDAGKVDINGDGCPDNSDGDSLIDENDRCPTLDAGKFDTNGDGCPDNSDHDLLIDENDTCPTTDAGSFDKNADGCPDDSDGDKVIDASDKCPRVKAGKFDRDGDGCPNKPPSVYGRLPSDIDVHRLGHVFNGLVVKKLAARVREAGVTVRLVCLRLCTAKEKHKSSARGRVELTALRGKRLQAKTVFVVRLTQPGHRGIQYHAEVGPAGGLLVTRQCIPLGRDKPGGKC